MDTEFEAKFYPVNKDKYRQRLLSLGAVCTIPERLMRRTIFDSRIYPQFKCDYIRVRDEGQLVRLSAKTHSSDGSIEGHKELDVIVSDYDKTINILKLCGFEPDQYIETLRETWILDDAEVVIDTWPDLDPYTEVEGRSEVHIKSVAQKLGLDWTKKIVSPSVEIYAEVYHLTNDEVLNRYKNLTFISHPFANLKKHVIINQQTD